MFPSHVFAPAVFPRNYFPGTVAERPSYFAHGVFPLAYYPDPVAIVPPPVQPPSPVGGGFARRFPFPGIPSRELEADFELPVPELTAYGFVTPPAITATLAAELVALQLEAIGTMAPAGVAAEVLASTPPFGLLANGTATRQRHSSGRTKAEDEAEEQALLEHYMLSLRGDS